MRRRVRPSRAEKSGDEIRSIVESMDDATKMSVMVTEAASKKALGGRDKVERLRDVIEQLASALDDNAQTAQRIAGSARYVI